MATEQVSLRVLKKIQIHSLNVQLSLGPTDTGFPPSVVVAFKGR